MRRTALALIVLTALSSSAFCAMLPTIANPGFEETAAGNDAPGWGWYTRADCGFRSSTTDPHSGSRCMVFWDNSPLAPEVYGRLFQGVKVFPSTRYRLSMWVRADAVEKGLHFTDWSSYRLDIPEGTYGWRKISTEFTTKPGQGDLNLGINVVNRCKELAVDDIMLVPVGQPLKGVKGSLVAPGQVTGDNAGATVGVIIESDLKPGARVGVTITAGKQKLLDKTVSVETDKWTEFQWNTGTTPLDVLECSVRVLDPSGRATGSGSAKIEKVSSTVLLARLDKVRSRTRELQRLVDQCRAKSIPVDYLVTALTTLEQFVPLTHRDAVKGEERRAAYAIKDLNRTLDEAISAARAYLKNPSLAPNARRYKTGPVSIDGLSFVGQREDSTGKASTGPVFFCGHGHFSQVRKDIPRWPGYGVNIIQIEIGPSVTFPEEDRVSLVAANGVLKVLDDAAKHNVKVNVLLSPHYFPEWAMKKWPHLAKGGGGFLGFCVDAPEAKQVIERFLRTVVPMLKDHPALHSFCLSNEPLFDRGAAADNTPPMWRDYLARAHGDIATLNRRYGTSHASFEAVSMPGNASYGDPQFYDWCVFNQERFAGWHRWMADVIHEIAPNVPVHAKMMWIPVTWRYSVALGIDPELFGRALEINGNDCTIWPGGDYWGISWAEQNMFYDLQRSVARKPVFNSENHLQPDGSTYYVPPEHYRTALWQGAVHGQGATTIWVWERTLDRGALAYASTTPFYGNVMDRPGCAQAVGVTCLDLNRFAEEVTALQNVEAPVAILYSMASFARNDHYLGTLGRVYGALNFCGVKVDFVTERMLGESLLMGSDFESLPISGHQMIVLPGASHITDGALAALAKLSDSTRIVLVGDCLTHDAYGKTRPASDAEQIRARALAISADADQEKVLWPRFMEELDRLGALPEVRVVDAKTAKPVWGVEWLPAKLGDRTVVNIVNLRATPFEVKLVREGGARRGEGEAPAEPLAARDLLSLGGKAGVGSLNPIAPVLAEVRP